MTMDALSLFGLFAVTAMLVAYALEDRSHWYILGLCRRMCARLGLRISAGRLAVRAGRGGLGRRCAAALERQAAMTRLLFSRQATNPCNALY